MEQARYNFVGPTIRRLRTSQHMTQEMFAARCGVAGYEIPRGTLAKIEAQIRGVTHLELWVIARVLGVKMEDLFPTNLAKRLRSGEFSNPE